jgi:2-polyprenyl-3-methyl-5-hydroxy-6-metoxy-1,4-benzoquinol methylase
MSQPFTPLFDPGTAIGHTVSYLIPAIRALAPSTPAPPRVLDIGCGNGCLTAVLADFGWKPIGIDTGAVAVEHARKAYPKIRFEIMGADDQLLAALGERPFDIVVSTEVIEHLYAPRALVRTAYAALRPGGRFILSAPYHGYLKSLLIAATGRMDHHFDPLWEGGHIKFFSRATLGRLLAEENFRNLQFRGAGRVPGLWMSMVMSGDRPSSTTPEK